MSAQTVAAAPGVVRVALYMRISRDPEGLALGVERQQADLEAEAAERGWTVVGIYPENDISASTLSTKPRPKFNKMLARIVAGEIDVVLAYTSGRLTRRPLEFETLIDVAVRTKVRYEFLNSPSFDLNTADGRMIARVLAAADAAEAERIRERLIRQGEQRRQSGKVHATRRCFGWADTMTTLPDGTVTAVHSYLHPHPGEAPLIREAFRLVATGKSVRFAGNYLAENAPHRKWVDQQVHQTMRRPLYAGLTRDADGNLIKAVNVTPIVDPAIWHAAQVKMDGNRAKRRAPRAEYLLSGMLVCNECGARMLPNKGAPNRKAGPQAPSWQCKKRQGIDACGKVARSMYIIDAIVRAEVTAAINRDRVSGEASPPEDDEAQAELAALRGRLAEVRALMRSGGMSMTDGSILLRDLHDDISTLETATRAASARAAQANLAATVDTLAVWLDERADVTVRRTILMTYVSSVLVGKPDMSQGRSRRQASIDSVTVVLVNGA